MDIEKTVIFNKKEIAQISAVYHHALEQCDDYSIDRFLEKNLPYNEETFNWEGYNKLAEPLVELKWHDFIVNNEVADEAFAEFEKLDSASYEEVVKLFQKYGEQPTESQIKLLKLIQEVGY